jgi:hypothetical protein
MAHTANFPMASLEEAFEKWLIMHGLWPPRFPYLNLCDYYVCVGHGKIQYRQSKFFARAERQYSKKNRQYFKIRAPSYIEKYFQ